MKLYLAECNRKQNPRFEGAKRRGPVPCGRAAWRVTALVALSDRGLSASRVLKPPRQQIAQQCGAGAKDRKSKNRNTDFQGDGKRPGGGMQRAEYLDQRGRQTDAGAVERRPRHAPGSLILVGREKRWKHGSSGGCIAHIGRCNPVRHGLTAVIRALYDAENYGAFEAAITADYDVQSALERCAIANWREPAFQKESSLLTSSRKKLPMTCSRIFGPTIS